MKRTPHRIVVIEVRDDIPPPGVDAMMKGTAYAWNSAIKTSEELVREHARQVGQPFTGENPIVHKDDQGHRESYEWVWVSEDGMRKLLVLMRPQEAR